MFNNYKFYDLEPEHNEIIKFDFLNFDHNTVTQNYNNIHIIGNPPFGRQSSLAIKFIKKCCYFSSSISFILPKSFKKRSMRKHFSSSFHLIFEMDLQEKSFLVNGIETNVECVFQIWKKEKEERIPEIKLNPINFEFVKKSCFRMNICRSKCTQGVFYVCFVGITLMSIPGITFWPESGRIPAIYKILC